MKNAALNWLVIAAAVALIAADIHRQVKPLNRKQPRPDWFGYQIYFHMDTVTIYDGSRYVGKYTTTWTGPLDSIVISDQ